ncbi:MAG TPA: hypothetical protein VHE33_08750 [Acidobacteriaceae bacterium]|nr:hypothetical protein [Acidobacteriaceae bacterium]
MRRVLLPVLMTALALAPYALASSDPERAANGSVPPADVTASNPATADLNAANPGVNASFLPPLPLAPSGKSTVIGGVIRSIDPVLDEMTLGVYGNGKPMKIYFDQRTKFYRDGVKTPLDDMRPNDHASVETLLDGDMVFAASVHMLSGSPEGDCQGQVLAFDPRNGEVTVRNSLSGAPIKLRVEPRTTIARIGQPAFASSVTGTSDLMMGALISVKFRSDNRGNGIADSISILATPGSGFYFAGNVTYLDVHAGMMAITDPRDQRSYTIAFNPTSFPASRNLHIGSRVGATASFNGKQYVASKLDVY